MSELTVGILGFVCIVAIVITLFKSKTMPSMAFIIFPSILGLILVLGGYYTIGEIGDLIKGGFKSTGPTAALFVFSVLFFGIMTDAGMFDVIIDKLMKYVGDNVIGVTVMTAVIALIGHLDGGGASTFLIVVPSMLPVYKKMHMRPTTLLRVAVLAMGVLNLMPWAGPTMRAASVLGMEAGQLWGGLIPIQIFGIILCLAHAVFAGIQEKKRGAGLEAGADTADLFSEADKTEEEKALLRPQLFWFNVALIVIVIIAMFASGLPTFLCFMVAAAIALIVNYPGTKIQNERLKSYAPTVLTMVSVLFASGVFTGVLNNSPMKDSMVEVVSGILEGSATAHINTVMGFLWGPLSAIGLNHEACAYTIVPMLQSIAADHITPVQAAASYLMTFVPQVFVNPGTAAMYIGLGLAGIDFKDHWKFTFKWVMLICTLCFAGSILVGTIPF